MLQHCSLSHLLSSHVQAANAKAAALSLLHHRDCIRSCLKACDGYEAQEEVTHAATAAARCSLHEFAGHEPVYLRRRATTCSSLRSPWARSPSA